MSTLWKGQVEFAGMSFPAKLYKSREAKGSAKPYESGLYHSCNTKPSQVYHCPTCDTYNKKGDLKTLHNVNGKLVELGELDVAQLPIKSNKTISIEAFMKETDHDFTNLIYEVWYLSHDKKLGSPKAYQLLQSSMKALGVIAFGKIAMRGREHLVYLKPYEDIFIVVALVYASELERFEDLKPEPVQLSEPEIKLGKDIVNALILKQFDHAKYVNEYGEALKQVIEAKAEGETIEVAEVIPATPQAEGDLVDQLEKTLATLGVKSS